MKNFGMLIICFIVLLTGCFSKPPGEEVAIPTVEITEPTEVIKIPSPNFAPTAEPTNTPAPTTIIVNVCSPIMGYPIDTLVNMISNPYYPPQPGSDDPHQGVDFSVMDPDLRIAVAGEAVQAILAGEVVMVMNDRFPYGNAVLVETAFEDLPIGWKKILKNQINPDAFGSNTSLTCPSGWNQPHDDQDEISLYILYAHLENILEFVPGDQVSCGEMIGSIGDSGNALVPHLHVEMRYGYASGIKGSMAHYDVSADEQEMINYCRWRVSGWYRIIDPMEIFFTSPDS